MARKALLASTETPAPVFFSGIFAVAIVAVIVAAVSVHSQPGPDAAQESFSTLEWGGIAFSYLLLWTVLALSNFIRQLWNVVKLGLVVLELHKVSVFVCVCVCVCVCVFVEIDR